MKQIFSFYVILAVMASVSFIFAGRVANQDSFWSQAAQAGQAEIMLGNLALQKSQNDDVKKFAQMVVDDHTKANDQLKTLAAGKNVTLPADVNIKQKETMDELSNLSGDNFDREFVKTMVKDHEAAVKLFQKQADSGADPDVKSFAASTLPTLKSHWDAAKSLNDSMKNMNKKTTTK
jgi:putative membrane protein